MCYCGYKLSIQQKKIKNNVKLKEIYRIEIN